MKFFIINDHDGLFLNIFLLINCNNVSEFTPSSGYKCVHDGVNSETLLQFINKKMFKNKPSWSLIIKNCIKMRLRESSL